MTDSIDRFVAAVDGELERLATILAHEPSAATLNHVRADLLGLAARVSAAPWADLAPLAQALEEAATR